MKQINAILKSVYTNATVQKDAKDLLKVIVGVVLAHYGLHYS